MAQVSLSEIDDEITKVCEMRAQGYVNNTNLTLLRKIRTYIKETTYDTEK